MSEGTFRKVGKSSTVLYGPRGMLVCGFSPFEHQEVLNFLKSIHLTDLPVIFATDADGNAVLQELMARADQTNCGMECRLERAVILSGIAENELQRTLTAYRQSELPRPLWATLTPFSESWTLSALLAELQKERMAMENKKS